MTSAIVLGLEILFLLLKAYLAKSSSTEKAKEHLIEAQERLQQAADIFELNIRFHHPAAGEVKNIQDQLNQNRPKGSKAK